MADSDYTVAVVLQASDEGMSAGIKKAADGIEDAGNKAKSAKINFMALMVGLEGLTSGLNQLTGGLRKYSAAMEQTGLATEEQTERLNKQIATIELFTGPMESIIALVKLSTVAHAVYTGIVSVNTSAVITATVANYGYATSLIAVNVAAVGFVAVVGLALLLILDTEKGLQTVEQGLQMTADALRAVRDILQDIVDLGAQAGENVSEFIGNIDFSSGRLGGGGLNAMGGGALA
tara:strand:+ start:695 stop:1396 length:702 start_codon:yes stop_codon:yes gene_type:complete